MPSDSAPWMAGFSFHFDPPLAPFHFCPPLRVQGTPTYAPRRGCYVPRGAGTLQHGLGRLRKSAIHPMRQCRAGHFSVPCPAKPLETLKDGDGVHGGRAR